MSCAESEMNFSFSFDLKQVFKILCLFAIFRTRFAEIMSFVGQFLQFNYKGINSGY